MSKAQQDDLKDVGGFVIGRLNGPRRKAENILDRDAVTLDFDTIPAYGTDAVVRGVEALGCGYCLHSTRKHRPEAPRLRVIIVTDRLMSPDEYELVARMIAARIGMQMADPTTFEPSRLMYWPSCCADSEYVYKCDTSKPLLSVDSMLQQFALLYGDWRDMTYWPKHPKETQPSQRGKKQADPTEKGGAIGAFCKLYSVWRVIEELIPDVYDPVDTDPNRFTYHGGTTTGGAIVYDGGKFLYSHHSTDPANGQRNAFDLLRIHKFGELDADAVQGTPTLRLPSYSAALEYVRALPDVQAALLQELAEEARQAFAPFVATGEPDEAALDKLAGFTGKTISLEIVRAALEAFGYSVRTNLVTAQMEVAGLPAKYSAGNGLNTIPIVLKDILKRFSIKGTNDQAIIGYLGVIADEGRYNPVCEMMQGTEWDGADRLSALVNNLLGLNDPFEKMLVRKWLLQCVALAFNSEVEPVGAEGVLTLQGEQGIGKTELFRRLAIHAAWFAEGVSLDMSNKDSIIKSVSCWICELGELDSTTRREQAALKGHLTAATDNIRAPYARAATRSPRRTSFCATVNPDAFLTDPTGNRRYWVIQVRNIDLAALLSTDRDWFVQLWAQVYRLWKEDRDGFRLTNNERDMLVSRNKQYETYLPGEEEIRQLLQNGFETIPVEQWTAWSAAALRRQLSWAGAGGNLTTQQIGRALGRIRQDFPEIKQLSGHNHLVQYLLPLPAQNAMK
ncbi:MAG: virulence-associated E family protein [Oscillospiraceae bacterium]|nr:virulence-associated E family protein [Oscillospiraceae bacterium]